MEVYNVITLLLGENSFEVERALGEIAKEFAGDVERYDGSELTLQQLPDITMGMALFSTKRLIVVRGLAENKAVWDVLPEWLARVSDDTHIVLVEPKPDKRTKAYKAVQALASVREFKALTERDGRAAEQWVATEAKARGVALTPAAAQLLVARVGVQPWALHHALEKLSVFSDVTEQQINEVIEAHLTENVFELFEAALKGNTTVVRDMIAVLARSEDPYITLGLLAGQAFQLLALSVAGDGDDVARDFGVHPFVISKLKPYASRRTAGQVRAIVASIDEADARMKTSATDPWLLIEAALLQIAA